MNFFKRWSILFTWPFYSFASKTQFAMQDASIAIKLLKSEKDTERLTDERVATLIEKHIEIPHWFNKVAKLPRVTLCWGAIFQTHAFKSSALKWLSHLDKAKNEGIIPEERLKLVPKILVEAAKNSLDDTQFNQYNTQWAEFFGKYGSFQNAFDYLKASTPERFTPFLEEYHNKNASRLTDVEKSQLLRFYKKKYFENGYDRPPFFNKQLSILIAILDRSVYSLDEFAIKAVLTSEKSQAAEHIYKFISRYTPHEMTLLRATLEGARFFPFLSLIAENSLFNRDKKSKLYRLLKRYFYGDEKMEKCARDWIERNADEDTRDLIKQIDIEEKGKDSLKPTGILQSSSGSALFQPTSELSGKEQPTVQTTEEQEAPGQTTAQDVSHSPPNP